MGCCTSGPKPLQADEIPKNFEIDPEESEHGGFVNSAAIAKLSTANDAVKKAERQSAEAHVVKSNASPAKAEASRVMSLEGHHQTKPVETVKRNGTKEDPSQLESSTILGRMSQHKRSHFFSPAFNGDPSRILSYLNDYDLARLTQVSRQFHGLVEGFISIRHAKNEMRSDWSDNQWSQLKLSTRGGDSQWTKLRRRLMKEGSVNIHEELADELTPSIFRDKYESKSLPCLIRGCAQEWKAFSSTTGWTLDSLTTRFPNSPFRFNDLHGEEILLRDYLLYARCTDDDSPLGLYDSQIGVEVNDARSVLLSEYRPPAFVGEDLFSLVPIDSRPPFRWILLGVPRSGTEMHVDPLETSAWVTVLSGRKKWCMFPPSTDDKLLGGVHALARIDDPSNPVIDSVQGGRQNGKRQHSPTACEWFMTYWNTPGTKVDGAVTLIQGPGDTVFIPGGWKHIVLNLEETVAITHNYAPKENLDKIRKCVRATEPEFSALWEPKLKEHGLV